MGNYLIKNGRLFDGTQELSKITDVLVVNGTIQAIEPHIVDLPDHTDIIDASGQWVVPGFIDNHTHYDGEILVAPELSESVRHGVTTVMLGGCSLSFVCADVEDCCDMFTRVEAFPREILFPILSDQKKWSSPKEWKHHLSTLPVGPNFASFLGHSDIRSAVMGIDRSLDESVTPSDDEIHQMTEILQDALDEGFVGISMQHNPWDKMDGRHWSKLLPAAYASSKERKALTEVVRNRGAHLLRTSMVAMMNLKGDPYIRSVLSGLVGFFNKFLGADFRMQSFPLPFRVLAEGMELVIFEEFPTGELARHLSRDLNKRNKTLMDPDYRKEFKKHYKSKLTPKVWQKDFGDAYVIKSPDSSMIGKSFLDIANERNQHPVDTFLDLVVEMDKEILWETTIGNHDPTNYKKHYNDENGVIGFADSGAHINNMAFYNMPIRFLRYVQWSHEQGDPIMDYEKAIWRLTKENADFFNLDAGHIAVGKRADITIIDPEALSDEVHEYHTADFLEDCERLVNRNDDVVKIVMINGKIAWDNGTYTMAYGKERFGQFLEAKHTQVQVRDSAQRTVEVA